VLREAPFPLLREHEVPVDKHVELPLRARDDLRLRGRARVDLGCETRSPPVVAVSDGAVVDLDAHRHKLPGRLPTAEAPTYTRLV
jgi:hypothetical protein